MDAARSVRARRKQRGIKKAQKQLVERDGLGDVDDDDERGDSGNVGPIDTEDADGARTSDATSQDDRNAAGTAASLAIDVTPLVSSSEFDVNLSGASSSNSSTDSESVVRLQPDFEVESSLGLQPATDPTPRHEVRYEAYLDHPCCPQPQPQPPYVAVDRVAAMSFLTGISFGDSDDGPTSPRPRKPRRTGSGVRRDGRARANGDTYSRNDKRSDNGSTRAKRRTRRDARGTLVEFNKMQRRGPQTSPHHKEHGHASKASLGDGVVSNNDGNVGSVSPGMAVDGHSQVGIGGGVGTDAWSDMERRGSSSHSRREHEDSERAYRILFTAPARHGFSAGSILSAFSVVGMHFGRTREERRQATVLQEPVHVEDLDEGQTTLKSALEKLGLVPRTVRELKKGRAHAHLLAPTWTLTVSQFLAFAAFISRLKSLLQRQKKQQQLENLQKQQALQSGAEGAEGHFGNRLREPGHQVTEEGVVASPVAGGMRADGAFRPLIGHRNSIDDWGSSRSMSRGGHVQLERTRVAASPASVLSAVASAGMAPPGAAWPRTVTLQCWEALSLREHEFYTSAHRTVLELPSFRGSILPYVRPDRLKAHLNRQFAERFPHVRVRLSRIRKAKRLLLAVCLEGDFERSSAALAFVLFDRLLQKRWPGEPSGRFFAQSVDIGAIAAEGIESGSSGDLLLPVSSASVLPGAQRSEAFDTVNETAAAGLPSQPSSQQSAAALGKWVLPGSLSSLTASEIATDGLTPRPTIDILDAVSGIWEPTRLLTNAHKQAATHCAVVGTATNPIDDADFGFDAGSDILSSGLEFCFESGPVPPMGVPLASDDDKTQASLQAPVTEDNVFLYAACCLVLAIKFNDRKMEPLSSEEREVGHKDSTLALLELLEKRLSVAKSDVLESEFLVLAELGFGVFESARVVLEELDRLQAHE